MNQGVFDLKFTVNSVTSSGEEQIKWTIDGEESSVTVIVRDSGDQFANVTEAFAKSVSPGNLDSFVSAPGGVVTLNPAILTTDLTYTLRLDSPAARTGFTIADQLPAGMDYVGGSFDAQITTWDADGLNRTTAPFTFAPTPAGNAFSEAVDVPGPSILSITYKARVTDKAALEALLQARYDALGGVAGNYEISLTNTAGFGGTNRTATVRLRGVLPGVNIGSAFGKTADWSTKDVEANGMGNLVPPVDITYTLKADLTQWTGGGDPNFTLDRNVVISDVLPPQASWNTADPAFITASGIGLAEVTCPVAVNVAAFQTNAYVGQWCVDGQSLFINLGQSNATNASVAVKAQLNTVTGLTQTGSTSIQDAVPYRWRNQAVFNYRAGGAYTATRDVTVVVLPNADEGLNDSSVFTKTGTPQDASINPGQSAVIDYTFKVNAGKGIDVRTSKLVDYVDTTVFDLSDLSTVVISGKYNGQVLNASHFQLGTDLAGNLVIELSAAGKTVVTTQGVDKNYEVKVSLTTKPFVGKQTKTIKNKATLFGDHDNPLYWSKTEAEATSYGDEAEVRKRVYDIAESDWAESVNAPMTGTGDLTQEIWVYRIEFIPHGSYNNVVVVPVLDLLPDAVDFLGFVNQADAATGANPVPGPVDVGGNLSASYDPLTSTVTMKQKPATVLQAGSPIAAYVAVKVTDPSAPIVNRIGSTSATIVPTPPGGTTPPGGGGGGEPPADPGPVAKTYAIGDFVWVDTNRDGAQGPDEQPLAGVKVELLKDGAVIGTTTTDAQGRYLFDSLPAGTYQVRFTLTPEQAAVYKFTGADVGSNDAVDSDADAGTGLTRTFVLDDSNPSLTKVYDRTIRATQGVDPTWDAGVVLLSAAPTQPGGQTGSGGVSTDATGGNGSKVSDADTAVGPTAKTGAELVTRDTGLLLGAIGAAALAMGALLLAVRRQRRV